MTSQSQQLKHLKEQLKGKIFDLKIAEYLLSLGERNPEYKEKQLQLIYSKLESWIFENIAKLKLDEQKDDVVIEQDITDLLDF